VGGYKEMCLLTWPRLLHAEKRSGRSREGWAQRHAAEASRQVLLQDAHRLRHQHTWWLLCAAAARRRVPPSPGACLLLSLFVFFAGISWDELYVSTGFGADYCSARQDMTQSPPTQELVAKDLHGMDWRFRHIFRGNFSFLISFC
jgi:hypothetical protein